MVCGGLWVVRGGVAWSFLPPGYVACTGTLWCLVCSGFSVAQGWDMGSLCVRTWAVSFRRATASCPSCGGLGWGCSKSLHRDPRSGARGAKEPCSESLHRVTNGRRALGWAALQWVTASPHRVAENLTSRALQWITAPPSRSRLLRGWVGLAVGHCIGAGRATDPGDCRGLQ